MPKLTIEYPVGIVDQAICEESKQWKEDGFSIYNYVETDNKFIFYVSGYPVYIKSTINTFLMTVSKEVKVSETEYLTEVNIEPSHKFTVTIK